MKKVIVIDRRFFTVITKVIIRMLFCIERKYVKNFSQKNILRR